MNRSYGNSTLSLLGFLWACALALMLGFSTSAQTMPMVALTEGVNSPPSSNQLLSFDSLTPETILSTVTITGLQAGESIVAMDARPSTGQLYGLGSSVGSPTVVTNTTGRLYMINSTTGVATQVGTMPFAVPLTGSRFGFDFDPVTDQIRMVSNARQNLRINPDTGQVIDADPATPGIQTDSLLGEVSDGSITVSAIAYTHNFPGAVSTTLYGINDYSGSLVRIGDVNGSPTSPNSGSLFSIGGPTGTNPLEFDIAPTGEAFITRPIAYDLDFATRPIRMPQLVGVNLTTGTATFERTIGTTPLQVVGLAVTPIQPGWWWNPDESGRGFSIEVS